MFDDSFNEFSEPGLAWVREGGGWAVQLNPVPLRQPPQTGPSGYLLGLSWGFVPNFELTCFRKHWTSVIWWQLPSIVLITVRLNILKILNQRWELFSKNIDALNTSNLMTVPILLMLLLLLISIMSLQITKPEQETSFIIICFKKVQLIWRDLILSI